MRRAVAPVDSRLFGAAEQVNCILPAPQKNTINTMVDQLNSFASEVTRVAREMGTEGKLGAADLTRARRHGDRIRSCLAAITHSRFWQEI
jgi:hypothetical protein